MECSVREPVGTCDGTVKRGELPVSKPVQLGHDGQHMSDYAGNQILKQVLGTKQYCCNWSKQGLKITFLNSLNNGVLLERQLQTAYSNENSKRDRWLPSEDVELYINGTRPFKL